jgi:serine/threonine-protein kinase
VTRKPAPRAPGIAGLLGRDWLFTLSLSLFVGVVTWFGHSVIDFLSPPDAVISAPTFIGQTETDATDLAQRTRLHAVVVAHTASDRYPKDVVMSQEPAPGVEVRPGRQISLIISTGVEIVPMPDLRYESLREVHFDLAHYRFQLGKTTTVVSDDVPADHVVSQNPPPLTSARVGSIVDLQISSGAPPGVSVPDFTHMSIDDARTEAERDHVQLGQVVWTPFGLYGPARGVVVRQLPYPGTHLSAGQSVSLQVSAGPLETGYLVHQVHALATVPATIDVALVRIVVRDDAGTRTMFSGYARGRQKFDFDITAIGTSALDMYVADSLVSSTSLGVEPPQQEQQQERPLPKGFKRPDPFSTPTPVPKRKSIPPRKSAG